MAECVVCSFWNYMLDEHRTWENVAWEIIERNEKQFGPYTVVDYFFDEVIGDGYYGDGCHEQGHQGDVFMVFERAGRYFKVSGTCNSYGNRSWGTVKEAFGEKVETIVYKFKEN